MVESALDLRVYLGTTLLFRLARKLLREEEGRWRKHCGLSILGSYQYRLAVMYPEC